MSLSKLLKKMNELAKTDKMERSIATTMLAVTADRIFTQGKKADGSPIGEYSAAYMKQRAKMNYPSSKKVILQATRQMANDWSVVSVDNALGLGFKNSANADKSEWVEERYGAIFKHTKDEKQQIDKITAKEIKKWLSGV